MEDDAAFEIRRLVRGGFRTAEEIVSVVCEEIFEDLDEAEVAKEVEREFDALRREQASWPAETDCDRLTKAFDALNARGIVALENAGYTQSDGYDDVRDAAPPGAQGYCFYHGQDLDRAVDGGGLYLAFGPLDPAQEESDGPRVGRIVVEELARRGFKTEWNGTFDQRIFIPKIDWKRRV